MNTTPETQSSRNFKIESKQLSFDLRDTQQYFRVRRRGKSQEWPTIGDRFGYFLIIDVITVDWTNRKIHAFSTPLTTPTYQEIPPISALEDTLSYQLIKDLITESYLVDFYTQQSIFELKKNDLEKEHPNKEIIVCGNEIFVGDYFDELMKTAKKKYPNRPFYSYSLKQEYSSL